ncbi:MAG: type IV secretory system conjugative DNA transfer family protein [Candidatus Bathyarchaeota archaeon]|nr:type IV secretory system conjugative DNA transfer family protein [Candidatus Bathyarchaeota archaeon]
MNVDNMYTSIKRKVTMVRVTVRNREKLRVLKSVFNLPTYDSVISLILSKELKEYPAVSYETVMADSIPIILTGLPGSGKTYFLQKMLIPKLSKDFAVFVVDVHAEYCNCHLKTLNLGDFFGLSFKNNNGKYRLLPSVNVDVSKSEVDSIFRHLIMFQKSLKDWIIILEEAHRFQESPFVRSFMAEARKHTRKFLVVSQDADLFKNIGRVLRQVPK